jgi:hypothetical protein
MLGRKKNTTSSTSTISALLKLIASPLTYCFSSEDAIHAEANKLFRVPSMDNDLFLDLPSPGPIEQTMDSPVNTAPKKAF